MFTTLISETTGLNNARHQVPQTVGVSLTSQPLSRTWRRQRRVARLARVPLAA